MEKFLIFFLFPGQKVSFKFLSTFKSTCFYCLIFVACDCDWLITQFPFLFLLKVLWCPLMIRWCARSRSWSRLTNVNFNIATYLADDLSHRLAPPTTKTKKNKQWISKRSCPSEVHFVTSSRVLSVNTKKNIATLIIEKFLRAATQKTHKTYKNPLKASTKKQTKPGKFLFSYDNKTYKNKYENVASWTTENQSAVFSE